MRQMRPLRFLRTFSRSLRTLRALRWTEIRLKLLSEETNVRQSVSQSVYVAAYRSPQPGGQWWSVVSGQSVNRSSSEFHRPPPWDTQTDTASCILELC